MEVCVRKYPSIINSGSRNFSVVIPNCRFAFCSKNGFWFGFFFSTFSNQQSKIMKDTGGTESVLPMKFVGACYVLNAS